MNAMNGIAGSIVRTYIHQAGVQPAQQAVQEQAAARSTAGRSRSDSVSLSRTTQELARLREATITAPDVRADRVLALKQAIRDGTYQIEAGTLAAKLLR